MSFSCQGGLLHGRSGHLLKTCGGQFIINLDHLFFIFDKIGESLSFSSSGWCSKVNSGSACPAYGACQDCPHRTPWQVGCLHDDRHHHYNLEQFIFIFLISLTDLCLVSILFTSENEYHTQVSSWLYWDFRNVDKNV